MRINRLLKSVFFLLCSLLAVQHAFCAETYFIGDQPVLLYKVINWWYDSLPAESGALCGKPIQCRNEGNAGIEYDALKKEVTINIRGGLAGMLLTFKACGDCYGPSRFHCTWLNRNMFKGGDATVVVVDSTVIQGFSFSPVEREQAGIIQTMADDLRFELEGVIGGLADGRVALHASAGLLKHCSAASDDQANFYPISLRIMNSKNNDVIAEFIHSDINICEKKWIVLCSIHEKNQNIRRGNRHTYSPR